MRLTVRLQDERYLDMTINTSKRECIFNTPIPEITVDELQQLANKNNYILHLPITDTTIQPEDLQQFVPDEELFFGISNIDVVDLILSLCSFIITEDKQ